MRNLRKDVYINEDEEMDAVMDEPFDPSRSIMVNNNDSIEFHKEVDSKGWDAVIRRLKKEGLGNSEVGYLYEAPMR